MGKVPAGKGKPSWSNAAAPGWTKHRATGMERAGVSPAATLQRVRAPLGPGMVCLHPPGQCQQSPRYPRGEMNENRGSESVIKAFNNNLLHQLTASNSQPLFKMKSRKYRGLTPVLVRGQRITSQKQNLEEEQRGYSRSEAG